MNDSLLEFPNEFPLKVVGAQSDSMRPAIEAMLTKIGIELIDISERTSRSNKYLALTVTVMARSQEQLDELYSRVSALDGVKWVL